MRETLVPEGKQWLEKNASAFFDWTPHKGSRREAVAGEERISVLRLPKN
ncbi:MAG TPA: hypothetical protein VLY83_06985 [Methanoregula sp.]|nr:hypothetical protein [Methanoregula sp.]